jgi:ADP-heptose:LPS heptosyltransferase
LNFQTKETKFLIIQTAFIGDVILATALIEKIHQYYPEAKIDFLLRKGNEDILSNHPFINKVIIWDKKNGKLKNLLKLTYDLRLATYEYVINCQRFFSSGFLTAFSGAKQTIGFDKNPLSFWFSKKAKHTISELHETSRNQLLIEHLTDSKPAKPKIYPAEMNLMGFGNPSGKFITISPASVWFTKQFHESKWIDLINSIPNQFDVVLLGGPGDKLLCESIKKDAANPSRICILAGRLSLLQSAAVMQQATLNYVNDSAPMHLCSAVNAPVCAVYCSTIPEFGFGPLSDFSRIVQVKEKLPCRPCGLHGHKACPEGHFKCALDIDNTDLIKVLDESR